MKCTIEINMDNAAFENEGELCDIIAYCANVCQNTTQNSVSTDVPLFDINGNRVGMLSLDTWKP